VTRGEIYTAAARGAYTGKPRPVAIVMVDKITTVPRSGLGERLGRLRDDELVQLNRSLMVFLGLAAVPQP